MVLGGAGERMGAASKPLARTAGDLETYLWETRT